MFCVARKEIVKKENQTKQQIREELKISNGGEAKGKTVRD